MNAGPFLSGKPYPVTPTNYSLFYEAVAQLFTLKELFNICFTHKLGLNCQSQISTCSKFRKGIRSHLLIQTTPRLALAKLAKDFVLVKSLYDSKDKVSSI